MHRSEALLKLPPLREVPYALKGRHALAIVIEFRASYLSHGHITALFQAFLCIFIEGFTSTRIPLISLSKTKVFTFGFSNSARTFQRLFEINGRRFDRDFDGIVSALIKTKKTKKKKVKKKEYKKEWNDKINTSEYKRIISLY